jgi:hypothetical protein
MSRGDPTELRRVTLYHSVYDLPNPILQRQARCH